MLGRKMKGLQMRKHILEEHDLQLKLKRTALKNDDIHSQPAILRDTSAHNRESKKD